MIDLKSMIGEILINLIIGTFFIWLGYLVYNKKKYNLLAGYNDMNKEQKRRVNIKRVSLSFKIAFYFIGISIAIIPSTLYLIAPRQETAADSRYRQS